MIVGNLFYLFVLIYINFVDIFFSGFGYFHLVVSILYSSLYSLMFGVALLRLYVLYVVGVTLFRLVARPRCCSYSLLVVCPSL